MNRPRQLSLKHMLYRRWFGSRIAATGVMAMLIFGALSSMAAEPEPDLSEILARVQLLPLTNRRDMMFFKNPADDAPATDMSPEEQVQAEKDKVWSEARKAQFTKWTRHEDELVSFLIPDDPRVRLEIKSPEDSIAVEGGPVRSNGIDFFRCYQLTFQDETYCLLLLDRQSEFDDSICFCGHVPYEKYLQHHDALYRFSLLEDGKIKKIQILGEGMRLVFFEWTHMPIHPEVYAKIAISVRWRQPPRDLQSLIAKVEKQYGKAGFLERGMDRDAVVAMLGTPTTEDATFLRYVSQRSYDEPPGSMVEEVTRNIPLTDGKFLGLTPDWEKTRNLPPEPNSVQWVVAKLDGRQGKSDSVEPATEAELQPLLARVIELLPKVGEGHWDQLCNAATLLAKRDVKDPRVLETIRNRFLDPKLTAEDASKALQEYDPEGNQELYVKRIQLEMSLARVPEALKQQEDWGIGWSCLEDLFRCLGETHPERNALIVEAIDHPNASVRIDGYRNWAELPKSQARTLLRKGLGDPSPDVRADCSAALVELPASAAENAEDVSLLRAQLAKEKNAGVIEALNRAIDEVE